MTGSENDADGPKWPPAMFVEEMQDAAEQTMETQNDLYKQFLSTSAGSNLDRLARMGPMWSQMATFKTRVRSNGRISIPDAEREALDIDEGDIVQTIVIPVERDQE